MVFNRFGFNAAGYFPTVQAGYTLALPTNAHPTPVGTNSGYGPFSIGSRQFCKDNCMAVPGYMFTATNSGLASQGVVITDITFQQILLKQHQIVD